MRYRLGVLGLVGMLGGCVSAPPVLPWAMATPGASCAGLSGRYLDDGRPYLATPSPWSLYNLVVTRLGQQVLPARPVSAGPSVTTLTVSEHGLAVAHGGQSAQVAWSEQVRCERGQVVMHRPEVDPAVIPERVTLAAAQDGALVLQDAAHAPRVRGGFVVGPAQWVRWAPAREAKAIEPAAQRR